MMNKLAPLFTHSKEYYLKKITSHFPDIQLIFKSQKPVVIYGAGRMGQLFLANLNKAGVSVAAFIDRDKKLQGKIISGVKIYSLQEAKKKFFTSPILIASLMYETEIAYLLKKARFPYVYPLAFLNLFYPKLFVSTEYDGIFNCLFVEKNQKQLIQLYDILADRRSKQVLLNLIQFRLTLDKKYIASARAKKNMYKNRKVLLLSPQEIFVDCGAYTGDSIEQFMSGVQNKYKIIYSFEPDGINYRKLNQYIATISDAKIIALPQVIYKHSGNISFDERGTVDSMIGDKSVHSKQISAVSLDDFFADSVPPTFIKMDIESGEIDALEGARSIIKKYKPKLAISSYHRFDHLWRVPLLIKKLNSNYHIYLRHYSDEIVDTMCIAI